MRKLLIPLAAAAALALPASAFAHNGHHGRHHGNNGRHNGALASLSFKANVKPHVHGNPPNAPAANSKLTGTGTSFGATSASVSGTSFTASLATTWSSATTKTLGGGTVSCAPSTASLTIGTAAADTFTGKTCSWTKNGTTLYGFYGTDSNGAHAFLKESGTTVTGAVFSRSKGLHFGVFAGAGMKGNCSH